MAVLVDTQLSAGRPAVVGDDPPEEGGAPAAAADRGDHSRRGDGLRAARRRGGRAVCRGACRALARGRPGREGGSLRARGRWSHGDGARRPEGGHGAPGEGPTTLPRVRREWAGGTDAYLVRDGAAPA